MKKNLVLISIFTLLIVITSICFISCVKINKDPNEQAKALEEKGCSVTLTTNEDALNLVAAGLEDLGVILFDKLEAYLIVTNGDSIGYFYYAGSLSDAERISDYYSSFGTQNTLLQDGKRVYIGDAEIYDCLK